MSLVFGSYLDVPYVLDESNEVRRHSCLFPNPEQENFAYFLSSGEEEFCRIPSEPDNQYCIEDYMTEDQEEEFRTCNTAKAIEILESAIRLALLKTPYRCM